jgi:uncharacterized repeat protein (TIGR02543 family)
MLGETATIFPYVDSTTPNVNPAYISNDGLISYSSGASIGCSVDSTTGVVTPALSGGSCLITAKVTAGSYYSAATKSISFTIANSTMRHAYFTVNDGSDKFQDISGALDTSIVAPAAPTRTGFAFLGWSESTSGTNLLAPGTSIKLNSDKTYYAIWKDLASSKINKSNIVIDSTTSGAVTYITNNGLSPPTESAHFGGETFTI